MIFIVDSDDKGLKQLKAAVEGMGYEAATFDSAESALDLIEGLVQFVSCCQICSGVYQFPVPLELREFP